MTSDLIFLITFASIGAGVGLGTLLRKRFPQAHLDSQPKEVIRLGTGLIGTLAALVIGLMIASAKNSYDAQNTNVRQLAADLILTDQLLAHYGPETHAIRSALRDAVATMTDRIWRGNSSSDHDAFAISSGGEQLIAAIEALSPANDIQRSLKERIAQAGTDLARTRLMIYVNDENPILIPFLMILIFWLTVIFASYGLFAEPDAVVVAALLIFAFSISGALFLIVDLSQPFAGVMQISQDPLIHALGPID